MNQRPRLVVKIIINVIIWVLIILFPYLFTESDRPKPPLIDKLIDLSFVMVYFYFNYFVLIKQYLFTRKYVIFISTNLFLLALLLFVRIQLHDFSHFPNNGNGDSFEVRGPEKFERRELPLDLQITKNIFPYLLSLGVAVAILATVKSNEEENQRKKIENEHLKSEISYLKYQVQPHFFFNTLNNIYSLIDTRPDYAKEVLHRLSKLMRFLLYQTNDHEVLIKDEITFIANYVELMKIRTQHNVSISIEIPQMVPDLRIPPLIYISLVENAFKHGIDPVKNSVIRIWFSVANDQLLFEVANTNFPKAQKDKSGSGIGVANVKKRLEILYKENEYTFNQQCVGDFFITKLIIPITNG
jgi:two-component sensor histidine kinase